MNASTVRAPWTCRVPDLPITHARCDHRHPSMRSPPTAYTTTPRTNMDAFRVLAQGRKDAWDPMLVIRFVRAIGIYLPVPRWS